MPYKFAPSPGMEVYHKEPPKGYIRYTELLKKRGWTPPALTRVWPDVVERLHAADTTVAVKKRQNWVRYVPIDTEVPLHPRLTRGITAPRPSVEVEPESSGDRSLLRTAMLPCHRLQQGGSSYYVAAVPAAVLLSQHVIRRLDHSTQGVNRLLNEARCVDIAQAMIDQVPFPDSITVHMEKPSIRSGMLRVNSSTEMEIIDGQHRVVALGLLSDAELARWSFTCHIYYDLTLRQKRALFFSQTERERIAPQIKLGLQNELGLFKTERQQTAYRTALVLGADTRSPIQGLVVSTERTYTKSGDQALKQRSLLPAGRYDVLTIYNIIQKSLGRNSVLTGMPQSRIVDVLIWTLQAAGQVWKSNWADELSSLRTAAGIATLVDLHNEPLFLACLGGEYTQARILQVLRAGKRFRWNTDRTREALSNQLGRGYRRRGADKASTVLARNIHNNYRKGKA